MGESSSDKASLDFETIAKEDSESNEVDFENSLEENINENVSSNEMVEEAIDDHYQPISGETYCNEDAAKNVVTKDLSENIEKPTEEKYDEEKEADEECHVKVAANDNVSSNEMAEEVIDDHDQPISGETYCNEDAANNVVTHDLSGNIDEEKYDEEKEAD